MGPSSLIISSSLDRRGREMGQGIWTTRGTFTLRDGRAPCLACHLPGYPRDCSMRNKAPCCLRHLNLESLSYNGLALPSPINSPYNSAKSFPFRFFQALGLRSIISQLCNPLAGSLPLLMPWASGPWFWRSSSQLGEVRTTVLGPSSAWRKE